MKVAVLDQKVRRNIALFKHLVNRNAIKRKWFYRSIQKSYRAFVNCQTGEIYFPDLTEKDPCEKEWKAITIKLEPTDEGSFCINEEGSKERFSCEELTSEAYTTLTKTLHILNQICDDPKQKKNPFWVLRQVSKLEFELLANEEGKKNLMQEAWFEGNREEAEQQLLNKPRGIYVFRKGEFALALEEILNRNFPVPISCFTLSYSSGDKKVSEKIIICKDESWQLYNDDPSLKGQSFSTLEELLANWGEFLQICFHKL